MKLHLLLIIALAMLSVSGCSDERPMAPDDGKVSVTGLVAVRDCGWLSPDIPYFQHSGREATVIFEGTGTGVSYERKTGNDSRYNLRLPPGQYSYEFYSYDWGPIGPMGITISDDTIIDLWSHAWRFSMAPDLRL